MEAKDFWSLADHTWMERWPKDAEGQMEQAERLALQSELDLSLIHISEPTRH